MPIVLIGLHALLPISFSDLAGTLYQGESSYNFIQVVQRNQTRYLLLNDGQGIHSIYTPDTIQTNGTWDYFTIAPYFNATPTPVQRVGIIGLAGGTIARSFTELFGPIPIDGIEIDPKIVEVGRKYFGMTMPNLNVIIGDGRAAIDQLPARQVYSVIGIDAFRVPYIPWHSDHARISARTARSPDARWRAGRQRGPHPHRLLNGGRDGAHGGHGVSVGARDRCGRFAQLDRVRDDAAHLDG